MSRSSQISQLSGRLAYLALQSSLLMIVSCFNEPSVSNAFRFECRSDEDCQENEQCVAELCQVRCNQYVEFDTNSAPTLSDDCPKDQGYIGCFNGLCSNLCTPGQGTCPGTQECISPTAATPQKRQPPMAPGEAFVCGNLCLEGVTICPENLPCVQGLCTPIPKSSSGGKF